jgi:hypothetical protein
LNALEDRIRAAIMDTAEEIAPGSVRPLELNHGRERLATAKRIFAGTRWAVLRGSASLRPRARVRRRLAAIAAAVVVIGTGTGLTAGVLLEGGAGRPSGPGTQARLTAWSVTKGPEGTVTVAIRQKQFSDPAGLQRALRADGVPVVVFVTGSESDTPPLPSGCRAPALSPKIGAQILARITTWPVDALQQELIREYGFDTHVQRVHGITTQYGLLRAPAGQILRNAESSTSVAIVIHTAEIPPGIGLELGVSPNSHPTKSTWMFGPSTGLVAASPQCTGS